MGLIVLILKDMANVLKDYCYSEVDEINVEVYGNDVRDSDYWMFSIYRGWLFAAEVEKEKE